jgi:hypothetical protein
MTVYLVTLACHHDSEDVTHVGIYSSYALADSAGQTALIRADTNGRGQRCDVYGLTILSFVVDETV